MSSHETIYPEPLAISDNIKTCRVKDLYSPWIERYKDVFCIVFNNEKYVTYCGKADTFECFPHSDFENPCGTAIAFFKHKIILAYNVQIAPNPCSHIEAHGQFLVIDILRLANSAFIAWIFDCIDAGFIPKVEWVLNWFDT